MDKEIHQALFSALSACVRNAALPIRQAYTNPGPPPPGIDQDVLYYHLLPDDRAPWTEESFSLTGAICSFRFAKYRLNLVIYGPHAEELAWRVSRRLFLDGYGLPRQILREQKIYPVPHPSAPALCREEWEKQHRLRADLTIPLLIAHTEQDHDAAPGLVLHPPEVNIHRDHQE